MPIYLYRCTSCKSEFKESHSMTERITDCDICELSNTLIRLPSNFAFFKKEEKEHKVGSLVHEFIEENKEDIKKEKERLRQQEYKK